MAFEVSLQNSTESVDFLDSSPAAAGVYLDDDGLQLDPPERTTEYVASYQGDIIVEERLTKRTVTLQFSIIATTQAGIYSTLSKISRIVNRSTTRIITKAAGQLAELVIQFPGSTNDNYLRVLSGEVSVPPYVFGVAGLLQKVHWNGTDYFILRGCKLELTCLPAIAEQSSIVPNETNPDLITVSLTNVHGTNTVLQIDNTLDSVGGGTHNGARFSGLAGDLPLPVIIRLDAAVAETYTKIYIAHSEISGASFNDKFCYALEAESPSGAGGIISGTSTADATMSAGNYYAFGVAAGDDDAFLSYYISPLERGIYRAIARFRTPPPSSVIMQARISAGGSGLEDVFFTPGEYIINADAKYYIDLGAFFLPHRLDDLFSPATLAISLVFNNTGASQANLQMDAIYLYNQSLGYRVLEIPGLSADPGNDYYDDGWLEKTYIDFGNANASILTPYFSPIFLQPSVSQRLSFLFVDDIGKVEKSTADLNLRVPSLYSFFV